jgi:hypothetical protein
MPLVIVVQDTHPARSEEDKNTRVNMRRHAYLPRAPPPDKDALPLLLNNRRRPRLPVLIKPTPVCLRSAAEAVEPSTERQSRRGGWPAVGWRR